MDQIITPSYCIWSQHCENNKWICALRIELGLYGGHAACKQMLWILSNIKHSERIHKYANGLTHLLSQTLTTPLTLMPSCWCITCVTNMKRHMSVQLQGVTVVRGAGAEGLSVPLGLASGYTPWWTCEACVRTSLEDCAMALQGYTRSIHRWEDERRWWPCKKWRDWWKWKSSNATSDGYIITIWSRSYFLRWAGAMLLCHCHYICLCKLMFDNMLW